MLPPVDVTVPLLVSAGPLIFRFPLACTESPDPCTVIVCPAAAFRFATPVICVAPVKVRPPVVAAIVTDLFAELAESDPPPVTFSPVAPVIVMEPAVLVTDPALLKVGVFMPKSVLPVRLG